MPLPLILGGMAIVSAVFGVKKGIEAKSDYEQAERTNRDARDIYDVAEEQLDSARNSANEAMMALGKSKFVIFEESIIPFVEAFKKIKNFEFDKQCIDNLNSLDANDNQDFKLIENSALAMKEVVGGGLASVGAGGLAGLAAYGGVGVLGTASTGTAIGTLSGAAATNATLAWLGGGSLATGGLGVAGGTAVLGGIVAGPVLAIGGMMLASKAEEAKENAYANHERATLAVEEMNLAKVSIEAIKGRFLELDSVLTQLNTTFIPSLEDLLRLNKEEPIRQKELKSNQVAIVMLEIETLLSIIDRYELSRLGLLNKFKNFFVENSDLIALLSSVKSLSNLLNGEQNKVLIDIGFPVLSSDCSEIKSQCLDIKQQLDQYANQPSDKVDYRLLSDENKKYLHMMFNLVNTMVNLLDVQILNEDGELTSDSSEMLEMGKNKLEIQNLT